MKTSNEQTFATRPAPGDNQVTHRFQRRNVQFVERKRGRKREPVTRCLLIGFDTEYQTFEPVSRDQIEAKDAKNEILSYQFAIKLIEQTPGGGLYHTNGIVIPGPDQRLHLEDFVSFAIGALIEKFPTLQIPPDIYLIGHFTRADLPAFSEFAGNAKKYLSNVRNTFASIDSSIPIEVEDHNGEQVAKLEIHLRDTLLLAPANAKSLADIGEIVGLEKIKLDDDRTKELFIKEHMKDFRDFSWARFREYAIRDAEVCIRYAEQVIRQYNDLFDVFKMPLTLTQFGSQLVLVDWDEANWKPDDLLGREAVKERKFSKKLGYVVEKTAHPYIEEVFYEAAFVTETYHGGRNEQFAFGASPVGLWRDHDLSSAYTTAMSLIGKPRWKEMEKLTEIGDVDPLSIAYYSVDFEFPENVRFPVLPVRTPSGIIFPLKGRSLCGAPEVFLAQRLGAKLRFRRGIKVPCDRNVPIFKNFIQSCIQKRGVHAKGTFGNLFWKEVGNSTYGKTAQGLRQKRVYDLRSDDMVELPESKLTQPFFASFITSFTRAVLGEMLNGFPTTVNVFSVTTDGFLSNATDADLELGCGGPLFNLFAAGRRALDASSEPLEIKHTIRQPIGWRTRGSATLKAGEGEKGNLVLQKGGIKTNQLFDLAEQNRHVIDLFLNRHPEQRLEYTIGVGLKDMVRFDADFVSRSVTKRLSMEYDWKRVPIDARDEHIEFDGKPYTHLSFETKPVPDFDHFLRVRDAWDNFDKNPRRNLKTLSNLEVFLRFIETRKHPDDVVKRYLRKEDGDLHRLRRDLCRAFVKHKAGFDIERGARELRYKDFAQMLVDNGIPCLISDIDNAKRAEFIEKTTPPTERAKEAINSLKRDCFPHLEIDRILAIDPVELESENP